jgi:hypothetical protein
MKSQTATKRRKELKLKMKTVFNDKIQTLSKDLQNILLDDLVTAFENRLTVLNRTQTNVQFATELTACVKLETI